MALVALGALISVMEMILRTHRTSRPRAQEPPVALLLEFLRTFCQPAAFPLSCETCVKNTQGLNAWVSLIRMGAISVVIMTFHAPRLGY